MTNELAESIKVKIQPFIEESGISCIVEFSEGDLEIITNEYFDFDFIDGINKILLDIDLEYLICSTTEPGEIKILMY